MGGSVGKFNSGNAYVYADNAPVMLTDPSGRDALSCLLAGAYSVGDVLLTVGIIIGIIATALFTPPPFQPLAVVGAISLGVGTLIFALGATAEEFKNCFG